MVAAVVVVASTTYFHLGDTAETLHEPSLASVSAEKTVIDFGDAGDCDGTDEELAVEVPLTNYQEADEIYVLVREEGGERTKTVWANPTSATVGETKTLANEGTGDSRVDVDIGSGGDWAYCPGDSATFEFYASTDGQTALLQRVDL
jgi:hypothetical protein